MNDPLTYHLFDLPVIKQRVSNKILSKKEVQDSNQNLLNHVICGDCLEIMRLLPSETADLVVTSPPYNLRNSSGNGMKDGRGGKLLEDIVKAPQSLEKFLLVCKNAN